MRIGVIYTYGPRSMAICTAMTHGIRKCGDPVHEINEEYYQSGSYDVVVFYGLKGKCSQAFGDFRGRPDRTVVYIDLGYWKRTDGGKLYGYHKIAVNSRHPTDYFQKVRHPKDRLEALELEVKPWQTDGRYILVAGMGPKAAEVERFRTNQWEADAIKKIRQYTDRPIIYRPKPSWQDPQPIEGTDFSPGSEPLEHLLKNCYAVVSHHSNVCVDALIAGVPVFCVQGVATSMGLKDIAKIETPYYPDGREQWAADIAYTQWKVEEMKAGLPWAHLKQEGLVR